MAAWSLTLLTEQYALYGLATAPGSLPGARAAGWLASVMYLCTFAPMPFLVLLFPDRRLPSRRWRPVLWALVAAMAGWAAQQCLLALERLDAVEAARLAGPSLPLDVGRSATIPAGIRHAVILRDQHCRWPGGCDQPAAACQGHHVAHQADGGPTSVRNCLLLCFFHHQVVLHRQGWTLLLHPDRTTTARSPDSTKILHSHGPPPRPG